MFFLHTSTSLCAYYIQLLTLPKWVRCLCIFVSHCLAKFFKDLRVFFKIKEVEFIFILLKISYISHWLYFFNENLFLPFNFKYYLPKLLVPLIFTCVLYVMPTQLLISSKNLNAFSIKIMLTLITQ